MSVLLATALLMVGQKPSPAIAPTATNAKAAVTVKLARELQGLRAIAVAPGPIGSQFVATMEDTSVRIIDANTRQTLKTFTGHPQPAYAAAWSDDGAYIATGDESARIFIWDTRTGQKIRTIYGDHQRGIQNLSFNHTRSLLMSTGKDDVVNIYNVTSGKRVAQVLGQGANLYGASFHPLNDSFVTATLTPSARLYQFGPQGAKVVNFYTGHANQGMMDAEFNRAGNRIITAGKDNNAVIWDAKTYQKQGTLKGHMDWVWQVQFAPSGAIAATSSPDRTVRIWDTKTYQQIGQIDNESGVGSPLCFTTDGKFLITVGINDYLQINAVTPAQPATPEKPVKVVKTKKPATKRGGKKG
jgi:WD40 repeat protein